MDGEHPMTKSSFRWGLPGLARGAGAIGGFGLLVNWPWEFLQVPLYATFTEAAHWEATVICTQAAFGDALILLVAFVIVATVSGGSRWLLEGGAGPRVAWVVAAFLLSMAFEVVSLHLLGRWAYSPRMPLVFGLGLSPVLQWILLPPLTLWLARRHLLGGRRIRDGAALDTRATSGLP